MVQKQQGHDQQGAGRAGCAHSCNRRTGVLPATPATLPPCSRCHDYVLVKAGPPPHPPPPPPPTPTHPTPTPTPTPHPTPPPPPPTHPHPQPPHPQPHPPTLLQSLELSVTNRTSTNDAFKLLFSKKKYWPGVIINVAVYTLLNWTGNKAIVYYGALGTHWVDLWAWRGLASQWSDLPPG